MFATLGEEAEFCRWTSLLGGQATPAAPTRRGGWSGAALVYIQAQLLFDSPRKADFRATVEAARHDGALLAIELGDTGWIRELGGPQAAYELAGMRPDILFASEAAASELGGPLEGIASMPVIRIESGGCSVHGRRVHAPASASNTAALAATFCVALMEGCAPVEAAGRAVLVAAE